MDKTASFNMHDTYLRYVRYKTTPNLPEAEKRKLIDGLVKILLDCNNLATDSGEVYHLTESFRRYNEKHSCH
jgi:hypothetical protein